MTCNDCSSLKEKLSQWVLLNDLTWAKRTLVADHRIRKMDEDSRITLCQESLSCAAETYRSLKEIYGNYRPSEYAAQLGIQVVADDSELTTLWLYFALYNAQPPTIRVATRAVMAVRQIIAEMSLEQVLGQVDLVELAIAHELFHHLEGLDPGIYTRSKHVEWVRFKWFKAKSSSLGASEIAGRHFSKLLMGLQYSPAIFEIILTNAQSSGGNRYV